MNTGKCLLKFLMMRELPGISYAEKFYDWNHSDWQNLKFVNTLNGIMLQRLMEVGDPINWMDLYSASGRASSEVEVFIFRTEWETKHMSSETPRTQSSTITRPQNTLVSNETATAKIPNPNCLKHFWSVLLDFEIGSIWDGPIRIENGPRWIYFQIS